MCGKARSKRLFFVNRNNINKAPSGPLLFLPTSIRMPSCDVVPDSTDLGTDHPNLRSITVVGDRFEPIQMPSNVSWVNIPTHTTVDVDQKNTKPRTSS